MEWKESLHTAAVCCLPAEQECCVTHRELLAIICFMQLVRPYLFGISCC